MEHPENSAEYAGLQVNSGVEQPSIINPYLKRNRFRRRELSVAEMVEGIVKGDITILSQAVTLVESVNPDHQAKAQEVINKCLPYSGNSIRIGISGVPGAGKSTSIDAFGIHVLKEYGGRLAVLAIDPSSERTKGSILGDKTRMEKLSVHPDSFIRPSPTAGSLGGVARKTRETIILCEAAGFDKIFVETVGVCKASSVALWRSPMASSSTNVMATMWTAVTWQPPTSAMPSTFSQNRRVVGCPRYCAIVVSTAQVSKRYGI